MSIKVLTPPTAEPITIAEAKRHLRVDHNLEDLKIEGLIKAAREWAEACTRRRLLNTVVKQTFAGWPRSDRFYLSESPLVSMATSDAVTYTDSGGTSQTLSTSDYSVTTDCEPAAIVRGHGVSWPTLQVSGVAHPVQAEYTAGYGTSRDDVPRGIRQGMLVHIASAYENPAAGPSEAAYNCLLPHILGTYP